MRKPTKRYSVKRDTEDMWSVIDIFTGQAANHGNRIMRELGNKTAQEYCVVLNALDIWRRQQRSV
jgi:hypothetical protein